MATENAAESVTEDSGAPAPEQMAQEMGATEAPTVPVSDSADLDEGEETPPEMWESLLNDEEPGVVEEEAETETTGEAAPEEPEAKPETETEAEAATTEEPATPEEPAAEETSPEPEATQEPEAEPEMTPEQQQALYEQTFKRLQETYQLSPDDAATLAVNPEEVMPRLLAGMHMNLQNQIMQQLQNVVPQTVQRQEVQKEAVNSFYKAYPNLRQHEKEVTSFAKIWRQMNPRATAQQASEEIGKHMMIALGYGQAEVNASEPPPPPPPPPPAGVTVAGDPPPPPRQLNQFESLAEEFLEED